MSNHYFTKHPTSGKRKGLVKCILRGREFQFLTSSGVFSSRKLDNGTRLLIENMTVPSKGRFLDLGCGYGPIGIVAASLQPDIMVWMTDINERAVNLAKANAKKSKVKNVVIEQGNLYSPVEGMTFQTIVSNPPISAGMKRVVSPMVREAPEYLSPGGSLQMVVQSNKGGKTLRGYMEETFGSVEIVTRGSGYRVFSSVKHF